MNKMSFLIEHLKGQRLRLFLVTLATVIFSFLSLFSSRVFSYVIDNVVQGLPVTDRILQGVTSLLGGMDCIRSHLYIVALFLLGIYVLTALLMYYRMSRQAVVAESLTKNIRDDLYNHLQLLPYAYHVRAKTGELVQRCTSDVDTIRRFFSGQLEEVFGIIASIIIALWTLISIDAKLAVFASISFPIIFIYSYLFFRKMQKLFLASDEKEEEMTGYIQEALSGVRVIKAFNRERYEMDRFLKHSNEYRHVTVGMLENLGNYWGMSYGICTAGILSVIVAGIFAVRGGTLSAGNFYVFIVYQTRVLWQIRNLGRILSDFGKLIVSIGRLQEIKNEPTEDLESGADADLHGDIVFENVSFHYADDPSYEVLKNISFTIPQGKTVAVIGPTGSGKSSLIHLLARLYDVTGGRILINGHDINEVRKNTLRRNIGIVLQEPFLFSKSIYDNLRIANPDLDDKSIYAASKIASIHDVINNFDKGYSTLVGEKGVTLSGGQKQRIAIARTIVNKTPILVFDDSLSAVDTETDAAIRQGLHSFDKDATMIIITQRILSAKDADLIIVLENGEVTEMGTHQELLAKEGLYQRISEIQNRREGGEEDVREV
ncbi:MAG: ABC transporter ATP-binding protein [Erysipelotrichaceae bacterium]|nr:ABC transporter ATP-binding protein [Erysipelotrichaceae bacterium]